MDGSTIVCHPLDPIDEVVTFLREVMTLRGYRCRALWHSLKFVKTYHSRLNKTQLGVELMNAVLLCAYSLGTSPTTPFAPSMRGQSRTYITTTERLDRVYTPFVRVAWRYRHHFKPTMVTDASGQLSEQLSGAGMTTLARPPQVRLTSASRQTEPIRIQRTLAVAREGV